MKDRERWRDREVEAKRIRERVDRYLLEASIDLGVSHRLLAMTFW